MARRLLFFLLLAGLFVGLVSVSFALDKAQLGSTIKMLACYYLPVLAAEEKGFWKENGLDVEWVPFPTPGHFFRAAAAGHINVGLAMTDSVLTAVDRGLSGMAVAELVPIFPLLVWVRADSPYRHIRELKGARIGTSSLGDPPHVYGRIMAKANGIEKDVRFVGAGGVPEMLAGLRAGAYEATLNSVTAAGHLKVAGIIRELGSNADYLPKPWVDIVVFSRKDFASSKPDILRKMVKATVQSADFLRKNPRWALDKMKSFQGISEEAAKLIFESAPFTSSGRLERKAVENVRSVLTEYGILNAKATSVEELFTNEYLP